MASDAIQQLLDARNLQDITTGAQELTEVNTEAAKSISETTDSVKSLNDCLPPTAENFVATNDAIEDTNNALNNLTTSIEDAAKALVPEAKDNNDTAVAEVVSGQDANVKQTVKKGALLSEASLSDLTAALKPQLTELFAEPLKNIGEQFVTLTTIERDILTTSKKGIEQAEIDKLMNKNKTQKVSESQFRNARKDMIVDSVALGKEIASGIKGTLSALFNPVALIAAFFVKFAPIIMLAVAFLYGVWEKLSDSIQLKLKIVFGLIIPIITSAFAVWKGVLPALIKAIGVAIKIVTIATRLKEHQMIMAIYARQMGEQAIEHGGKMSNIMTEKAQQSTSFISKMSNIITEKVQQLTLFIERRINAIVEAVQNNTLFLSRLANVIFEKTKALILFVLRMTLALLSFILEKAAILFKIALAVVVAALVIAAIVLLAAGVVLLFKYLGDMIFKSIGKVFSFIANLGKSALRWLFGKGDKEDSKKEKEKKQEVTTVNGDTVVKAELVGDSNMTKDDYNSLVNKIITPLNDIKYIINELKQSFGNFGITSNLGYTPAVNKTTNTFVRGANSYNTTDSAETNIQRSNDNSMSINNESGAPYNDFEKDFKSLVKDMRDLMTKLKPYAHLQLTKV